MLSSTPLGTVEAPRPTVAVIPAVRSAPDATRAAPVPAPTVPPPTVPAPALAAPAVPAPTVPASARRVLRRAVVVDAPGPGDAGASPAPILAEQLSRRGAGVDVIADADVPPDALPEALLAVVAGAGGRPSQGAWHSPDLVVGITGLDGDADAATRLADRCRARLLLVVQGLAHPVPEHVRYGLRRADQLAVPTESFRQALHAHGVDDDRITVLPTWAQPAPPVFDRSDARRRLGWPERSFIAVHPGPMAPEHELEHLLAAAALLGPDSIVALTGDGPCRSALAACAAQVPNALVPGPMDAEQQVLALVAADALLVSEPAVPTRLTRPVELARCLSAGRPVVATAPVAGTVCAELARTAGAGLVVPPAEPARLAGALLALRADPMHRVTMSLAAIAYAESRLSRETVLPRFDLVVDAALC